MSLDGAQAIEERFNRETDRWLNENFADDTTDLSLLRGSSLWREKSLALARKQDIVTASHLTNIAKHIAQQISSVELKNLAESYQLAADAYIDYCSNRFFDAEQRLEEAIRLNEELISLGCNPLILRCADLSGNLSRIYLSTNRVQRALAVIKTWFCMLFTGELDSRDCAPSLPRSAIRIISLDLDVQLVVIQKFRTILSRLLREANENESRQATMSILSILDTSQAFAHHAEAKNMAQWLKIQGRMQLHSTKIDLEENHHNSLRCS